MNNKYFNEIMQSVNAIINLYNVYNSSSEFTEQEKVARLDNLASRAIEILDDARFNHIIIPKQYRLSLYKIIKGKSF